VGELERIYRCGFAFSNRGRFLKPQGRSHESKDGITFRVRRRSSGCALNLTRYPL
jgi:hypothetical protein